MEYSRKKKRSTMLNNKSTKIILSLNAVAIVVAGLVIANALNPNFGFDLKVVNEHSDDVSGEVAASMDEVEGSTYDSKTSPYAVRYSSSGTLPTGELWAEGTMMLYVSADYDICAESSAKVNGEMYWQTSNKNVIEGFYEESRTYLGFPSTTCRFPKIVGTGTTTITAGTYNGEFRDQITLTVEEIPVQEWKTQVLKLVNNERSKEGLTSLVWGETCAEAADLRAVEISKRYEHVRPDGSDWSTACPVPSSGGASGENIHAGNSAVSPETVVHDWMNSPAHKENILDERFTKLSVGLYFNSDTKYGIHWSQIFSTY